MTYNIINCINIGENMKKNYKYNGDLFIEENLIPENDAVVVNSESNLEQILNLEPEDVIVIKKREDDQIDRTYGVKFAGSHYDFLNNPITENFNKLTLDDIKKINLKLMLDYKLGFKEKHENENLINFLIKEKGLNIEQASFLDHVIKQIKPKPDIAGVMSSFLLDAKINEDSNIFASQQVNAFKDDFSFIALKQYLKLIHSVIDIENIKQINSDVELKTFFKDAISKSRNNVKTDVLSVCGKHISTQITRQGRNLKLELSRLGEGDLKQEDRIHLTELYEKSGLNSHIDNLVEYLDKLIQRFKFDDSKLIALDLKETLLDIKNRGLAQNLMDLYKQAILTKSENFNTLQTKFNWAYFAENEIALLKTNMLKKDCDFSKELEGFNKYFNLTIRPVRLSDGELSYMGTIKKIKNVAAVHRVSGYITIYAPTEKEIFEKTIVKYNEFLEKGLIVEKIKPVIIKTTNNKSLNKDLFIEVYPELKNIIIKQFKDVDFASSPETILLNNGVRGIEMGKTLKNKDNVLWNTIAVMASISDRMGISIKEFTFDGSFGIALGSRGNAKSLAYFSCDQFLLAFTQKNEFESIVHEYAHALDFALAEFLKQDLIKNNPERRFINVDSFATNSQIYDLCATHKISPENKNLFNKLIEFKNAIKNSQVYVNSVKKDAGKTKKYWSSDVEIFARVSETVAASKINLDQTPLIGCHKNYSADVYPNFNIENDNILIQAFIDLEKEIIEKYPLIAMEISKVVLNRDAISKNIDIDIN